MERLAQVVSSFNSGRGPHLIDDADTHAVTSRRARRCAARRTVSPRSDYRIAPDLGPHCRRGTMKYAEDFPTGAAVPVAGDAAYA